MRYLLTLFALVSTLALGQASNFSAPTTASVTSTTGLKFAGNGKRNYLLIINTGSVTAYLKFGSAQSGNEGIELIAGGVYEPIKAPGNPLYAKTASGSTTLVIIQGQ